MIRAGSRVRIEYRGQVCRGKVICRSGSRCQVEFTPPGLDHAIYWFGPVGWATREV